jgi:4-diphosphocytidyl-2-C-methyl-D-erythritol kinase
VAQALDWLGEYGEARLTGTGACIFAGFDHKQQAEDALAQLPADIGRGFVVKGLNQSPLMQRLHQEQAGMA